MSALPQKSALTPSPKVKDTCFCTSCGNWFPALDEITGWCDQCSGGINTPAILALRVERYLLANADEIEHYILQGHSLWKSIDLLHAHESRPKCIVCGEVIKRARREAIFCRNTSECRRYSRRYVYLYREKGMSKAQALAQVLSDLT